MRTCITCPYLLSLSETGNKNSFVCSHDYFLRDGSIILQPSRKKVEPITNKEIPEKPIWCPKEKEKK